MTAFRRKFQSPGYCIGLDLAKMEKPAVLLDFVSMNTVVLIAGKVPDRDEKMMPVGSSHNVRSGKPIGWLQLAGITDLIQRKLSIVTHSTGGDAKLLFIAEEDKGFGRVESDMPWSDIIRDFNPGRKQCLQCAAIRGEAGMNQSCFQDQFVNFPHRFFDKQDPFAVVRPLRSFSEAAHLPDICWQVSGRMTIPALVAVDWLVADAGVNGLHGFPRNLSLYF